MMKNLYFTLCAAIALCLLPLSLSAAPTDTASSSAVPALAEKTIPSQLTEVFPKCDKLTDLGSGWMAVMNGKKLLGYAAYSKPASDGIKGFKGETPLLLCFNVKQEIVAVKLLANQETPSFVARVRDGGLFDAWNGLTVSKALAKTPDAVSGATYTSRGVIATMQVTLQELNQRIPAISKSAGSNTLAIILPLAALALILIVLSRRRKQTPGTPAAGAPTR